MRFKDFIIVDTTARSLFKLNQENRKIFKECMRDLLYFIENNPESIDDSLPNSDKSPAKAKKASRSTLGSKPVKTSIDGMHLGAISAARKDRLGSSSAATLSDPNPFKTTRDVLQNRTGEKAAHIFQDEMKVDWDMWDRTKIALELGGIPAEDLEMLPNLGNAEDRLAVFDQLHKGKEGDIQDRVSPERLAAEIKKRLGNVIPDPYYKEYFAIQKLKRIQSGDIKTPEDQQLADKWAEVESNLDVDKQTIDAARAVSLKHGSLPPLGQDEYEKLKKTGVLNKKLGITEPTGPDAPGPWETDDVDDDDLDQIYQTYAYPGQFQVHGVLNPPGERANVKVPTWKIPDEKGKGGGYLSGSGKPYYPFVDWTTLKENNYKLELHPENAYRALEKAGVQVISPEEVDIEMARKILQDISDETVFIPRWPKGSRAEINWRTDYTGSNLGVQNPESVAPKSQPGFLQHLTKRRPLRIKADRSDESIRKQIEREMQRTGRNREGQIWSDDKGYAQDTSLPFFPKGDPQVLRTVEKQSSTRPSPEWEAKYKAKNTKEHQELWDSIIQVADIMAKHVNPRDYECDDKEDYKYQLMAFLGDPMAHKVGSIKFRNDPLERIRVGLILAKDFKRSTKAEKQASGHAGVIKGKEGGETDALSTHANTGRERETVSIGVFGDAVADWIRGPESEKLGAKEKQAFIKKLKGNPTTGTKGMQDAIRDRDIGSINSIIVSIRKLNSDLGGSNDGSTGPLAPMIALIKDTRNKVETGEYEDDIEPEFDSGSYDED